MIIDLALHNLRAKEQKEPSPADTKVEDWEEAWSELRHKYLGMAIVGTDEELERAADDTTAFIKDLIEKVRQEANESGYQEGLRVAAQKVEGENFTSYQKGLQEGIKMERERILAALRPCFFYCLEVNGRDDCKNCGLHESLITPSHPSV
jgi:uncharacterized Ntn-hydrolase superfamily protein